MRKYVIYTRVSTDEQGKSGLGLEAQQRDIELFLQNFSEVPFEVIGSFQDVASGAADSLPERGKAIALAKKHGAELLVAKLDRLARRVSFLATLMDDPKLKLRVASMPAADKFQLHIYAALAEQEREFISARTKAALASAKARGVKLGGHRGPALDRANAVRLAAADQHAEKVAKIALPMREGGASLAAIAEALNAQGLRGAQGGEFSKKAVARVLERLPDAAFRRLAEAAR